MNLLLTSVGRRSYIVDYFKEALAGIGRVHAANSEFTYAMHLADESVITPLIHDNSYIDFLLDYCVINGINAVLSLFDMDLPALAENKERFLERGIQLVVSDYETIRICNDKWLTNQFLKENGFDVPLSFVSLQHSLEAIENRVLRFPVVIKPRFGMGSIGVYQADHTEELIILAAKTRQAILGTYLKYEPMALLENNIIIQENIKGREICIDAINDLDGNYLAGITMWVKAMRAGESDIVEIVDEKKLHSIAREVSTKLKIIANWNIDTIMHEGRCYILEMNCRINGLSPFSYLAGANYFKAIIQMLMNQPLSEALFTVKTGLTGYKALNPVAIGKAI